MAGNDVSNQSYGAESDPCATSFCPDDAKKSLYAFRLPVGMGSPITASLLLKLLWPEASNDAREQVYNRGCMGYLTQEPTEKDFESDLETVWVEWTAGYEAQIHEMLWEHTWVVRHLSCLPQHVWVDLEPPFLDLDPEVYGRGNGWALIEKPVGFEAGDLIDGSRQPMDPLSFVADRLGFDREQVTPLWPASRRAGGPWLLCTDAHVQNQMLNWFSSGNIGHLWTALVSSFDCSTGEFTGKSGQSNGLRISYATSRIQAGWMEIQITPDFASWWTDAERATPSKAGLLFDPVRLICDVLASAGHPVLNDLECRSCGVSPVFTGGPLRIRLTSLYDLSNTSSAESVESDPFRLEPQQDTFSSLFGWWSVPDSEWWPTFNRIPRVEKGHVESYKSINKRSASSRNGFKIAFEHPEEVPTLTVSRKTLDILRKTGHPWILADEDTAASCDWTAGTLVALVTSNGDPTGLYALLEGGEKKLRARLWGDNFEEVRDLRREVIYRLNVALSIRNDHIQHTDTTLYRLIHGEADRLPGFHLDSCGPVLRSVIYGGTAQLFKGWIYDALKSVDKSIIILEVEHQQDVRIAGELPTASRVVGPALFQEGAKMIGYELTLKYEVNPWEGIDTGFFPDQRDNRLALARIVERLTNTSHTETRWLNLFCHTGAFTVRLIALNASVVSVDLSSRFLEWLERNLALNRLDSSKNQSVREDVRHYVASELLSIQHGITTGFDGIILDPPTASTGDGGFWSVRRDYEDLIEQSMKCLRSMNGGGCKSVMLVCRNDRRKNAPLQALVNRAAKHLGAIVKFKDAGPSVDYPVQEGFQEGRRFEGVWVWVSRGNKSKKGGPL